MGSAVSTRDRADDNEMPLAHHSERVHCLIVDPLNSAVESVSRQGAVSRDRLFKEVLACEGASARHFVRSGQAHAETRVDS